MDCIPSLIYSGFIRKYLLGKLSYIINIIKIVDCIDMEKSIYKTYKMDPDTIVKYKKLFFKWDNIKDNKIFWLKHLEGGLLVCTDEVKNQIENAHLYGLGFELLGEN